MCVRLSLSIFCSGTDFPDAPAGRLDSALIPLLGTFLDINVAYFESGVGWSPVNKALAAAITAKTRAAKEP